MKVLAIKKPGGGNYHRIQLPLSYMENVTFVTEEELTEDLIQNYNILYCHWNVPLTIPLLSVWRKKYGFKVIVDVDDTWQLPKEYNKSVFISQQSCNFADGIICTNRLIAQEVAKFNPNIAIIDNYLPFGEKQFVVGQKPDKIGIGIAGSISHYDDWILLKNSLKRINNDPEIQEKCQFYIIGVDGNSKWKHIVKMFYNPIIVHTQPEESYLNVYDNLHIMLLPSCGDRRSICRSNLKVWECGVKGIIPIVGKHYFYKDPINDGLLVENWYYNIKSLLKTQLPNLEKADILRHAHDYYKECVQTREDFFRNIFSQKNLAEDYSDHEIISIVYDNQDVEYPPYVNKVSTIEEKSYLFEYNVILDYIPNVSDIFKYCGVFSHKFPFKTGFYRKLVDQILDKEDSDIVAFCNPRFKERYLAFTEEQHPGFIKPFVKICDRLGLTVNEPNYPIYSNFFVAKPSVYKEYCKVLQQAINIMENDPEIKDLVWKDAKYTGGLGSKQLKEFTGLDYYTFHTFILERLLSVWIDNKKIKTQLYY